MTQERLTGLASLNSHWDIKIDYLKLDIFAWEYPTGYNSVMY